MLLISGTLEQPTPWSTHLTTYPNKVCAELEISLFISSTDQLGLSAIGMVKRSSSLAGSLSINFFCSLKIFISW